MFGVFFVLLLYFFISLPYLKFVWTVFSVCTIKDIIKVHCIKFIQEQKEHQ